MLYMNNVLLKATDQPIQRQFAPISDLRYSH